MAGGDRAGGSLGLIKAVDEFPEELLADFQQVYNMWLPDAIREKPPGLVLALMRQLPLGMRYASARRGGPEYRGWDLSAYMAADRWDTLNKLLETLIRVNSKKPEAVKEFPRYPRPDTKTEVKMSTLGAMVRGEKVAPDFPTESATKAAPGKIIPLRR